MSLCVLLHRDCSTGTGTDSQRRKSFKFVTTLVLLGFAGGFYVSSILSSLAFFDPSHPEDEWLTLNSWMEQNNVKKATERKRTNNKAASATSRKFEAVSVPPEAVSIKEVKHESIATNLRYHEMPPDEFTAIQKDKLPNSVTSYTDATVVEKSPNWFPPTDPRETFCTRTCCATPVALSLVQDDHRIINTVDGLDLADVLLRYYHNPEHIDFFAPDLTPNIVPCLQPGAIIHMDNYKKTYRYFFQELRPNITVPFALITSESDRNSPIMFGKRIQTDDLMIKWYGQSVLLGNVHVEKLAKDGNKIKPSDAEYKNETRRVMEKLVSFPLGLSKYHNQHRLLTLYLELRNYTNPFKGSEQKQRWIKWAGSLEQAKSGKKLDRKVNNDLSGTELRDVLFVKYGINEYSHPMRKELFEQLCKNSTYIPKDKVSCQTKSITPHEIYSAASTYLFGLSPNGLGWDCYRTYELLLLGVIPIVKGREGGTHGLFQDLPVLELPLDWDSATAQPDDYLKLMHAYVKSPAFLENDFAGWERLFLRYWRRKILSDLGRDNDVVTDEFGREFLKTWRYGPNPGSPILCSKKGKCNTAKRIKYMEKRKKAKADAEII